MLELGDLVAIIALSGATAMLGAIGGIGGAVILVPVLVLLGWSPLDAAPLGMAMVAASALAATVVHTPGTHANHRLGVTMEIAASLGAAAGALVSILIAPRALVVVLGVAAIVSALVGGTRTGQRNLPVDGARMTDHHDQRGRLDSAYSDEKGRVIPYRVHRVPLGVALMGLAGTIAGMTGSSGGYIKTPVMSEVLHVPVKVAAATTVFMVGITASVSLAVYALQGRVTAAIAPAILGGLLGGRFGARVQPRLPAPLVRRVLSVALFAIGLIVVVSP
ncbi:MAG: TSUP family transporter [Nitriliruptoraceae bacterium]